MNEVYAFEWCDCAYESAFGLVSLHARKVDAYRAMRRRLLVEWDQESGVRAWPGWKPLSSSAWRVRPVQVEE